MGLINRFLCWLNKSTEDSYWNGFLTRDEFSADRDAVMELFESFKNVIDANAAHSKHVSDFMEQQKKINGLLLDKVDRVCKKVDIDNEDSEVYRYLR